MEPTNKRPRGWPGGPRLTPAQSDLALAAAVLMFSGATVAYAGLALHTNVALGLAAAPFTAIPLLWRRRRPGLVLLVTAVAFIVATDSVAGGPDGFGLVLAGYAAALYGTRRTRLLGGAAAAVALVLALASTMVMAGNGTITGMGTRGTGDGTLTHLTAIAFLLPLAWVLGERTRTRRAYLAGLVQRADRLERERDERAARSAAEERSRIARELHDVVTHNVSVIAVQAGAARRISASDPGRALTTLGTIEETARGTLTELRALLGVLRKGSDEPSALRRPRPALGQLTDLADQAREAGVRLGVRIEGTKRPLPALVDLCAYRVIQEALTNVIRHAPHTRAHLLVRYGHRDLRIVVVDDGPGPPAAPEPAVPGGHGLLGMRERVSLAGGDLLVGPALGGGFRVEARLPLEPDEPGEPDQAAEHAARPDQLAQQDPHVVAATAGSEPG